MSALWSMPSLMVGASRWRPAEYAAVGGGSYHWVVRDLDGTQRFATVDDLDQKPWLADTRDAVFVGLRRAFDTAGALHDLGLDFVVAPIRTDRGEAVRRIGPRHAIALFPFVDGQRRYVRALRGRRDACRGRRHARRPPSSDTRRDVLGARGRSRRPRTSPHRSRAARARRDVVGRAVLRAGTQALADACGRRGRTARARGPPGCRRREPRRADGSSRTGSPTPPTYLDR